MARETRASARPGEPQATPSKRKRNPSPPASTATSTPSLKVVLPIVNKNGNGPSTSASPEKAESDPKRQRISLRVSSNTSAPVGDEADAEGEDEEDEEEDVKQAPGHVLDADVRGALATVISQMAVNLPSPLNNVLALGLPPSFTKTDDNTLEQLLKQDTLTWEHLVDTLHLFAENLLVPCSYPNPLPTRAQIHLPVPPLPAYFRPHVIYNFCAGLHSLLLQIEPGQSLDKAVERWALVQRLPQGNGTEWFTGPADSRVIGAALAKVPNATSLLQALAARGDKFGNASAISLQTVGKREHKKVPLGDSLVRRASLKAARWRELRAQRRGGFGSIERGVAPIERSSWTASFAPTYDSSKTTGGGSYYSTLTGMHERAKVNEWKRRMTVREEIDSTWQGEIDEATKEKGKAKAVEEVLEDNEAIIGELEQWQAVRVRQGHAAPSERENALAHALFASLTSLASGTKPGDLAQLMEGSAHDLAERLIPTPSPSIQGTLDPARRQALHDNLTVRHRPQPKAAPSQYNSPAPHRYQPPPPRQTPGPGVPGPQTPYSPNHGYRPPPSVFGYTSQSPQAVGSPYNSPGTPTSAYVRPGPGPSALRQSFGPGPGGPGIPGMPVGVPGMPGVGVPGVPVQGVQGMPGMAMGGMAGMAIPGMSGTPVGAGLYTRNPAAALMSQLGQQAYR